MTTSISWDATEGYPSELMTTKPKVAINIAFTFAGLLALKLPTATLGGMPFEFIDGMAKRAPILGDIVESDPQHWDPIWRNPDKDPRRVVHVMIALSAQMNNVDGTPVPELQDETDWLIALCKKYGIVICQGHRPGNGAYQDASLLLAPSANGVRPLPSEHFGFADGFGKATFEPMDPNEQATGGGKLSGSGSGSRWRPASSCSATRRGAGDPRRGVPRVQPQRHLHGLSQAASRTWPVSTVTSRRRRKAHAGMHGLDARTKRARRSWPSWSGRWSTACR